MKNLLLISILLFGCASQHPIPTVAIANPERHPPLTRDEIRPIFLGACQKSANQAFCGCTWDQAESIFSLEEMQSGMQHYEVKMNFLRLKLIENCLDQL